MRQSSYRRFISAHALSPFGNFLTFYCVIYLLLPTFLYHKVCARLQLQLLFLFPHSDYANGVFFCGTLETDIKFYCSCCHDFDLAYTISDLASSIVVVLIEHSSSSPGQLARTNGNASRNSSRWAQLRIGCRTELVTVFINL